jgi:hypothetical protein
MCSPDGDPATALETPTLIERQSHRSIFGATVRYSLLEAIASSSKLNCYEHVVG